MPQILLEICVILEFSIPNISRSKEVDTTKKSRVLKDLSRVKAGFKSVPLHQYFEFRATLPHWPSDFKIKLRRNAFKAGFYPAKIFDIALTGFQLQNLA